MSLGIRRVVSDNFDNARLVEKVVLLSTTSVVVGSRPATTHPEIANVIYFFLF